MQSRLRTPAELEAAGGLGAELGKVPGHHLDLARKAFTLVTQMVFWISNYQVEFGYWAEQAAVPSVRTASREFRQDRHFHLRGASEAMWKGPGFC